jgi:hypothetical protein
MPEDAQSLIARITDALKPKETGAHWRGSGSEIRPRRSPRSFGYAGGNLGDRDVKGAADATWAQASQQAWGVPSLLAKDQFIVTIAPQGPELWNAQMVIAVMDHAPLRLALTLRCQAYFAPQEFVGRSVKLAQAPIRRGARAVSKDRTKRRIVDHGPTWFQIDRPVETEGQDWVALFE